MDVSLKIWKLRNITWVNRGGFSIVNRVLRGGLWKIDCKWGGISLVWHNLNPRIPHSPPPPHTGPQVINNDQCQSMNLRCRLKASTEVAAQIGRPVAWVRHSSISVVVSNCCLDREIWDQYQFLGNCPPTPPLTQQQSIDNKLRLMLG